jgi:hypothetical protein
MILEYAINQLAIRDVALVEIPVGGELSPAGHQVIKDYRLNISIEAGRRDRAANEASPPCN